MSKEVVNVLLYYCTSMVDQISENERPKDQDPKDLNRQLRDFCLNIHKITPPDIFEDVLKAFNNLKKLSREDIMGIHKGGLESIERRANNEAYHRLTERLKGLVEPANVTQAMKDYLVSDFQEGLITGGVAPDVDHLPIWIDDEGNTGIYDPDKEKVKPIERSVYSGYMKSALREKAVEYEHSKFMGRPTRTVQDQHLPGWRAEFTARYGEEP